MQQVGPFASNDNNKGALRVCAQQRDEAGTCTFHNCTQVSRRRQSHWQRFSLSIFYTQHSNLFFRSYSIQSSGSQFTSCNSEQAVSVWRKPTLVCSFLQSIHVCGSHVWGGLLLLSGWICCFVCWNECCILQCCKLLCGSEASVAWLIKINQDMVNLESSWLQVQQHILLSCTNVENTCAYPVSLVYRHKKPVVNIIMDHVSLMFLCCHLCAHVWHLLRINPKILNVFFIAIIFFGLT